MWLFYALLNPVVDASRNVFSKRASKNVDPLLVTWFNNLVPTLLLSPVLFWVDFSFRPQFLISITISGLGNIATAILYHRAISKGDISEVVPMLSFTPLFLLFSSPFLVNEMPDATGLAGILLITAGSYILNLKDYRRNFLAPLRSLYRNKGSRYMLIVAVIWSISANFDKRGIQASSVWQYVFCINLFVVTGTTIVLLAKRKLQFSEIKKEKTNLFLVGILTAVGFVAHTFALSLTLVAYVIALKRTAGLISVLLGHFFLDEPHLKKRITGAFIMFIGVVILVLF
ncbi:MAG: EamA family transporter [Ignavibacteriaceae bacterium]|nr:EamA family transporter [Ignavibacteriaceae bacterium]